MLVEEEEEGEDGVGKSAEEKADENDFRARFGYHTLMIHVESGRKTSLCSTMYSRSTHLATDLEKY